MRPSRRPRLSVMFLTVMVLALWGSARDTATQSPTASYGVTDLGALGGASSAALGIDDYGFPHIVGYAATASREEHAFEGTAFGLNDLGTLGGARSEAMANGDGGIVGRAQRADGAYRAFLYRWQGLMDLGTLGGSESYATASEYINGVIVVGASQTSGNAATRAFIYQNGAMAPLGATLGGPNSVATGINDLGHVVGYADLPGGAVHHAFLYANGVTTDLGSLGTTSEASALNDDGVIVGGSRLRSGDQHAFRYENGAMQDLGTLGGASSEALDIDRDGAIVGWADTSQGERRAFIWRAGEMSDLNTLIPAETGWLLQAATGISNNGEIAGYGTLNGQRRAFVLTPPIDLRVDLYVHSNDQSTNIPDPHETGQRLLLGVSVYQNGPHTASGVTIIDTISGPVEYEAWDGGECEQDGQRLTCRVAPVEFSRDLFIYVRTTAAGDISHSATIAADQPDPNPSNNSASESNTAVSLASLTLNPTTLIGGKSSLGRATLTSRTPAGGATVKLTSSRPDIASVPSQFDVLPWSGDGLWREFYVTTKPVSAPVTVQIGGTYGLVTISVPLTIMPQGSQWPVGGSARAIPGTIQAEDFDEGGEGVAYHDTSRNNNGDAYRSTDVDIQATIDVGGGWNVGWMTASEWLEYSVNVANAGTYTLTARVAANGVGGTFHVEFGGVDKTGPLTIPNTGGWQVWRDVKATVTLNAGAQVMRFVANRNGPTGVFGNLNYLKLAAQTTAPSDVVLYASDLTLHGAWVRQSDATAAAGQKALTPDTGWSTSSAPLASPTHYLEATFDAPAATPYTLWLRLRATGDTKYSESVWVQLSDARANGAAVYPIGSTSGLLVNLEPCFSCGVSGWGWQNRAYWLSQATTLTFATAGRHTLRIQVREDGAQLDQVVFSPSRYLNAPPGPVRNDSTIVPK